MPIRTCVRHMARQVCRVVVDRPDQRGLGADHRAGARDPAHRLGEHRRLELARMREVRHYRQRPARGDDLAEQPEGRVGVRVGDEPLRPVGQRLGADPDRLEVVQAVRRVDERLDVPAEHRLAHDHGIAAGDQDAGHLGMLARGRPPACRRRPWPSSARARRRTAPTGSSSCSTRGRSGLAGGRRARSPGTCAAGRAAACRPGWASSAAAGRPDGGSAASGSRARRRAGRPRGRRCRSCPRAAARPPRAACPAEERRAGRSGRRGPRPSRSGSRSRTSWSGTAARSPPPGPPAVRSADRPARCASMSRCFAE